MTDPTPRPRLPEAMRRAGLPTQIVIYPDHGNDWRHAVFHERPGILDGRLRGTAGGSAESARAAAETMVRNVCAEYYGCAVEIEWGPANAAGMMSGRIHRPPRPI